MKQFKYTGITIAVFCIFGMALLSSCKKDFFEIPDPTGIEGELAFEDEGAVGLFLNRTYALVIPKWPVSGGTTTESIHNTSDESNGANTAFLYGTLVENSVTDIASAAGITSNRYSDIRRCNVGIDGLNSSVTISEASKKTLKGQFFFLRAYTYFKLVRLYGGVPLVFHAQGVDDDNLQIPRSKTSDCIAAIANDLDSAAAYLPKSWPTSEAGRITKAAALSVKAKALLYWASPQFSPSGPVASRWEAAYQANKTAYDTCVAHGYGLIASYANIFTTEDHKEVLIVRKYNTSKDFGTNIENQARPYSESSAGSGSYQPTWNLVKSYLKADGLPTNSADKTTAYDDTCFWLNRDPRFAATIAFNGDSWAFPGNAKPIRKQWNYKGNLDETSGLVTGFYCKRLCNTAVSAAQAVYNSNSGGGSGMDWIEMRFAEVVLNLAECANETGRMAEAKNMVRLIRQRAGIVAGAGSNDYGLSIATDIPTMRTLLLNERQIEFAMEGMRNYDLRRTRNLSQITVRQSYIVTPKPPYYAGTTRSGALPTDIFLDKADALGVKPRDTINVNNKYTYARIFGITPATIPASLEGSNVISIPDKYYAYPMPNLFIQTPAIQQTLGWSGGTFNPYE
jgi:hypothetical protein